MKEDAHLAIPDMGDKHNTAIYGIFDGHCGAEVARYVGKTLRTVLEAERYTHTVMANTTGQWHALIDCYGRTHTHTACFADDSRYFVVGSAGCERTAA